MEHISIIAVALSFIGVISSILGALISFNSIKNRISIEKELANRIFEIYREQQNTDEISKVIVALENSVDNQNENKYLKLYLQHIDEAIKSLDETKREIISPAITQESDKGRYNFLNKLAKEVISFRHI